MVLFTPSNQIKLTNVSIVRLKKGGNRFELACYNNKVVEFRQNIVKDLNDVLQSWSIFSNVSKGELSKRDTIKKCFGSSSEQEIILEILKKGDIQISTKEREHKAESVKKEICQIVSEKCINTKTNKPYTASMIDSMIKSNNISITMEISAKKQALGIIKELSKNKTLHISRTPLNIEINCPFNYAGDIKAQLGNMFDDLSLKSIAEEENMIIRCKIYPWMLKDISEMVKSTTSGNGFVYEINQSK